jgi:hypothetical protein
MDPVMLQLLSGDLHPEKLQPAAGVIMNYRQSLGQVTEKLSPQWGVRRAFAAGTCR